MYPIQKTLKMNSRILATNTVVKFSVRELLSYRRHLKKKIWYYHFLFNEAVMAEEENQDDYGMLGSIQKQMDYAERKLMKYQLKLDTIDGMMVSRIVSE
jgi:hypothetical protein